MLEQCAFGSLTNLFTELTVHACNMFTRLNSDRKWLVEMKVILQQALLSVDPYMQIHTDTDGSFNCTATYGKGCVYKQLP